MTKKINTTARENLHSSSRQLQDYVFIFMKGLMMGAADSVPGVSGGTIAFICNIYEELIDSLKGINVEAVKTLFAKGPLAFWVSINGNFLLVLFLGILTSLIILANTVIFFLEQYPQFLYSFFTGLIVASTLMVSKGVDEWKLSLIIMLLLGLCVCVALSFLPVQHNEPELYLYFFGGAFAICAMILPGISGAFILILLGMYHPVLSALKSINLPVVVVFVAGCATGLIVFSRFLSWLFHHHRQGILSFLTGILLGSLYSLWPWQKGISFIESEEGLVEAVQFQPVLPSEFIKISGQEVDVLWCIILAAIGFLLVFGLERISKKSAV